jgi:hypothetical protein
MAKAELSELEIDMNSVTTLKDFKRLVDKEKKTENFVMFITVNSTKYEYECKYRLETVSFLSENSTPFLSLCFDGDGLIQITGLKFKTIESLTPLDTTFYLRTFFYRMIQIETFKIFDNAIVTCKNKDKDKTKYRALLYRLFATNKPLYELSIYYKYFTKFRLDTNYLNVDTLDLKDLLVKYRLLGHAIPKDFMDKPDCSENAKLLNELFDTLRTTPEFQTFYNILSYFSVETKDSIYYPCCKTCNGLSCARQGHLDKSKQSLFKSRNARKIKSKRRRSKLKKHYL